MTIHLSAHFTLEELTASQEAARRGLDNTPGPAELAALRRSAQGMEAVRVRLGGAPILVSSGYRSPAVNQAVGGSAKSQHMRGEAVDFTAPRFGTPATIVAALVDSGIEYDQLILEYDRWVHISFAAGEPRRQAFRVDRRGAGPLWA